MGEPAWAALCFVASTAFWLLLATAIWQQQQPCRIGLQHLSNHHHPPPTHPTHGCWHLSSPPTPTHLPWYRGVASFQQEVLDLELDDARRQRTKLKIDKYRADIEVSRGIDGDECCSTHEACML